MKGERNSVVETVKLGRIVDKNAPKRGRIGCPGVKQVEQPAGIGRVLRHVHMRPVTAP
ncbi:hypothetical protein D3C71_1926170 [compost metagenome]